MINIVGGSGFIGTRLSQLLQQRQLPFRIIDKRRSDDFPDQTVIADVRVPEQLMQAVDPGATLINLAAEHRDDVRPISLYYDVNVQGAVNLCAAAEAKGVRKLLFTSSVAVYGFAPVGTDESGLIQPFNDYGKSKAQAEEVLRQWQARAPAERSLVIVRPTVVFGERNRGNVYNLLRQVARGRFMMVGAGTNRKSMAYVENVASFLIHTQNLPAGVHVYNYIDKPDFSMNELVSTIDAALGQPGRSRPRLPYAAGLLMGTLLDVVARISGRSFPISAIRVKKFCSDSSYSTAVGQTGFHAPVPLGDALSRTIRHEFVEQHTDRPLFYSE
ncbi:NAD-dependent epimerase/dehydratase family protein [Ideonella sp.]|uniref:NAD-dependent epimerase/dehydratase family protein n=1 Tax=Ideonella sp. TaxID=1929293 RepID=UPI003BB64BCE